MYALVKQQVCICMHELMCTYSSFLLLCKITAIICSHWLMRKQSSSWGTVVTAASNYTKTGRHAYDMFVPYTNTQTELMPNIIKGVGIRTQSSGLTHFSFPFSSSFPSSSSSTSPSSPWAGAVTCWARQISTCR